MKRSGERRKQDLSTHGRPRVNAYRKGCSSFIDLPLESSIKLLPLGSCVLNKETQT